MTRREVLALISELNKTANAYARDIEDEVHRCGRSMYESGCMPQRRFIDSIGKFVSRTSHMYKSISDAISFSGASPDEPLAWFDETVATYRSDLDDLYKTYCKIRGTCIKKPRPIVNPNGW